MPKALDASSRGLDPHWKIRMVIGGTVLHLASSTEPKVTLQTNGVPCISWDPINDHAYGDTLGFYREEEVIAVSWRYAP